MNNSIKTNTLRLGPNKKAIVLVGLSMFSAATFADPISGFEMLLDAHAVYSDNHFYEDDQERATAAGVIIPTFRLSNRTRHTTWEVQSQIEAAAYTAQRQDNYVDTSSGIRWGRSFASAAIDVELGYKTDHDPFGTDRTIGLSTQNRDLDKWNEPRGRIQLVWGRSGTHIVWLNLTSEIRDREYTTNETETSFLNRQEIYNSLEFNFQFSPKTALLINPFYNFVDYDDPFVTGGIDFSGETLGALIGLRWAATAKTSGDVRFGAAERETESTNEVFDSSFWQAGISWNPIARTSIRLFTGRSYLPSYQGGSQFIDAIRSGVQWTQDWNDRLSSTAAVSINSNDFVGTGESDDILTGSIKSNYQLDANLTLFVEIQHFNRDGTVDTRDAERNTLTLGFKSKFN